MSEMLQYNIGKTMLQVAGVTSVEVALVGT